MKKIERRTVLRGLGVAMALPLLEAMHSSVGAESSQRRSIPRMVLIDFGFGLHAPNLFPAKPGIDYAPTPYLKLLKSFRDDFTLISGTSHPDVDGGHFAAKAFLTSAPKPASAGFRNTISLDQFAAEQIGHETRFASLTLSLLEGRGLSYSRTGVEIPAESRPSKLFGRLFFDGDAAERERQRQRLKDGQSIMDAVNESARALQKRLAANDRQKLDQYFTAIRDTEKRLATAETWEKTPKPKVKMAEPKDILNVADVVGRARQMYELIHLALLTDSTRLVTLFNPGVNAVPPIAGITQDYHNLSHHGQDPRRIAELTIIESEQLKAFADFLSKLKEARTTDGSLLEETVVLLGSDLGNGSSHDNRNLPVILAGGGFRHAGYLAFDRDRNVPLCNLFVTMLRRLGLDVNQFGSSTGTIAGL